MSLSQTILRRSEKLGPGSGHQDDYLHHEQTVKSWLVTTDHKRIGILYLISITAAFVIGAIAAALIRISLVVPNGSIFTNDTYDRLFTLHGVIMVWFFLIPSIPNTLGNFLLPLMIGAKDVAFPRLNLLSWYIYIISFLFTVFVMLAGGVDTGWTFYTPLSTRYADSWVTAAAFGVLLVGFSSILTGLNFIVTTHKLRAPGMTWFRLPLFVWGLYATSLTMVLATPVLTIVLVMLAIERAFDIGVFNPKIGGDPVLFQHLFWFYSHPAVYIMVLPGMGVMSELITAFSYKHIFGYKFIAYSSVAIAAFGFFVWGHHMFYNGISEYSGLTFSLMSFVIAVPSAIKVYNWTVTIHKGDIRLNTPLLYALGWIWLFVIGGITGLFLAATGLDAQLHNTYFVIAHFHYIMVGASVSAFFGGIHFWWPKITGRMYHEIWGRIAAATMFFGFNLTFAPQFILGYMGMPRRYHDYPAKFQFLNILSSTGSLVLGIAYFMPFIYLIWSLFYGERAGPNPWEAKGLEWTTSSPPPPHNFEEMPVVDFEPYDYPNHIPEV
jgi:cytochrome c oxidase subunit 1